MGNLLEIIKNHIRIKRLRKYKNALKNYSLEEIKLIGKGRKVCLVPFPYDKENLKDNVKIVYDKESSNRPQHYDLLSGESFNMNYWVAYSRSRNPKNNIDLWLRIGELEADYLVKCYPLSGRIIGIPVKKTG